MCGGAHDISPSFFQIEASGVHTVGEHLVVLTSGQEHIWGEDGEIVWVGVHEAEGSAVDDVFALAQCSVEFPVCELSLAKGGTNGTLG